MKTKKMTNLLQIFALVVLIVMVLLNIIDLLIALMVMIIIQFVIGNIVYPLIYKKHYQKYNKIIESYNVTSIVVSNEIVTSKDGSKKFLSKMYVMLFYATIISLGLCLVLYTILWFINSSVFSDTYIIIIGLLVIAPLNLFMVNKFISFPLLFDAKGITGNFKTGLDFTMKFKKDKLSFSTIKSFTLLENHLIDPSKDIAMIEFELEDGQMRYLNFLLYSKKNRKRIIDILKESLGSIEKQNQ